MKNILLTLLLKVVLCSPMEPDFHHKTKQLSLNDQCTPDGSKGYCAAENSRCASDDGGLGYQCECIPPYMPSSNAPHDTKAFCYLSPEADTFEDSCRTDIECADLIGKDGSACMGNRCICVERAGYTLIKLQHRAFCGLHASSAAGTSIQLYAVVFYLTFFSYWAIVLCPY